MLVISARKDEVVVLDLGDGSQIRIRVVHCAPSKGKLVLDLPPTVTVSRVRETSVRGHDGRTAMT